MVIPLKKTSAQWFFLIQNIFYDKNNYYFNWLPLKDML